MNHDGPCFCPLARENRNPLFCYPLRVFVCRVGIRPGISLPYLVERVFAAREFHVLQNPVGVLMFQDHPARITVRCSGFCQSDILSIPVRIIGVAPRQKQDLYWCRCSKREEAAHSLSPYTLLSSFLPGSSTSALCPGVLFVRAVHQFL